MTFDIQRGALPDFVLRLQEPRQFLQVVAGPRQVGKTTVVRQALACRCKTGLEPIRNFVFEA